MHLYVLLQSIWICIVNFPFIKMVFYYLVFEQNMLLVRTPFLSLSCAIILSCCLTFSLFLLFVFALPRSCRALPQMPARSGRRRGGSEERRGRRPHPSPSRAERNERQTVRILVFFLPLYLFYVFFYYVFIFVIFSVVVVSSSLIMSSLVYLI